MLSRRTTDFRCGCSPAEAMTDEYTESWKWYSTFWPIRIAESYHWARRWRQKVVDLRITAKGYRSRGYGNISQAHTHTHHSNSLATVGIGGFHLTYWGAELVSHLRKRKWRRLISLLSTGDSKEIDWRCYRCSTVGIGCFPFSRPI